MTPWTALLESFHSAAVDALLEIAPEPKPILGLPARTQTFAPPPQWAQQPPADYQVCICPVYFGELNAILAVALHTHAAKNLDPQQILTKIKGKLGHEFMLRNIKPRLGDLRLLALTKGAPEWALPPSYASPTRSIWIPIEVAGEKVLLVMGV